jgi:hypothetical protein
LDHLGVFTTGEHEGRETVAQRVQGDVRQTRTLEQRLKGTPEDVVALRGVPTVEVKSRPVSCQAAIGCSSKYPRRSTDCC